MLFTPGIEYKGHLILGSNGMHSNMNLIYVHVFKYIGIPDYIITLSIPTLYCFAF